jgi:NTP pyrophosphatase (non-canonical NTP hydrolase)
VDGGSSYKASQINKDMLREEIGGIAIYLDLLASLLEIDLEEAITETFNKKSEELGFAQRI